MILSALVFFPLPILIAILFVPEGAKSWIRRLGLGALLGQTLLFLSLISPGFFHTSANSLGGFPISERYAWIDLGLGGMGRLAIDYHLAMDGTSYLMALLTVLILPIAAMASFTIEKRLKAYWALFLLLDISLLGCFLAQDFFLFYIFFELMLLPMFFLIGIWGGERREYAAIKFFLYTLFGSVFMLLVMAGLGMSYSDPVATTQNLGLPATTQNIRSVQNNLVRGEVPQEKVVHTLNFQDISASLPGGHPANLLPESPFHPSKNRFLGLDLRMWAFLLLLLGFAIKLPTVPFHTWLPDAHVEAPTAVSVVLAAVLLKVGGYGILRIAFGLFPDGAIHFAAWIGAAGLISILYGALVAMRQTDLKSMIAYSSVSHMGYVLLGLSALTATGYHGAVFQMFNHGIISAALFLIVGVLYDRTHDRHISHYKGLWGKMPAFTFVVILAFFASMGLPGLNGFVSEALAIFAAFGGPWLPKWIAFVSVLGILFGSVYYLRAFRTMFFGEFAYKQSNEVSWGDLSGREYLMLVPLCLGMVLLGIMPSLVLEIVDVNLSDLSANAINMGQVLLHMVE